MKKLIGTSMLVIFVLVGFGCGKQQVEAKQEQPQQQEVNLALDKDGDVLGFQIGSSYVLSVEAWGNAGSHWYAGDAFKKFHAETTKLEKQGWTLESNSIQTSRTQYSAWIVATFRKRE